MICITCMMDTVGETYNSQIKFLNVYNVYNFVVV